MSTRLVIQFEMHVLLIQRWVVYKFIQNKVSLFQLHFLLFMSNVQLNYKSLH